MALPAQGMLALEPPKEEPAFPPEAAAEILQCVANLLLQIVEDEHRQEGNDEPAP